MITRNVTFQLYNIYLSRRWPPLVEYCKFTPNSGDRNGSSPSRKFIKRNNFGSRKNTSRSLSTFAHKFLTSLYGRKWNSTDKNLLAIRTAFYYYRSLFESITIELFSIYNSWIWFMYDYSFIMVSAIKEADLVRILKKSIFFCIF